MRARRTGAAMTPADFDLWIRTIVVIGQPAPMRKAFIAGFDHEPVPARSSEAKAANYLFGRQVQETIARERPKLMADPEPEPVVEVLPSAGNGPAHHPDLIQGSEEWYAARCGLITASEMKLLLTPPPNLKFASNDKERAQIVELAAQRITRYVEPQYISDDMLRGSEDEIEATSLYALTYNAPVEAIGFITNDRFGFTMGYSPDAKIVGKKAGIENKSRRQRFQVDTICTLEMPVEYVLQLQTGLLVSEWDWIDFNSYSAGLPMLTLRVFPDPVVQDAIVNAAGNAERRINELVARYREVLVSDALLIPTERKIEQEMFT